jgi:hypothetical protein
MQANDQLIQPHLDPETLATLDDCARELTRCADEADKAAALALGGAEVAMLHAQNAGAVLTRAKSMLPPNEFILWADNHMGGRGYRTAERWMGLTKLNVHQLFEASNPVFKELRDGYVATGLLPEPRYVRFDRDALLESTTLARYEAHAKALQNRWKTVNEVRADEDMASVPWGDVPNEHGPRSAAGDDDGITAGL